MILDKSEMTEEILDPMDLIRRYQNERSALNVELDRTLAEIVAKLGAPVKSARRTAIPGAAPWSATEDE